MKQAAWIYEDIQTEGGNLRLNSTSDRIAIPMTGHKSGCLTSCTYEYPSGNEYVNIIPANIK